MKTVVISVIVFGFLAIGFITPLRADDLADCKSAVPERAIPGCTRLLDAGTLSRHNQANAHNSRGIAFGRDGREDLAIADFSKAIELRPTFASAYSNRGFSYNKQRQYDLAIADLDAAIKLKPTLSQAYVNRAVSFIGKGEYRRAIADNTTAIELNPNGTMAYNNRAYAYLRASRLREALADLQRAISIDPENAGTHHTLGEAYFHSGESDRALEAWKDACRLASKAIVMDWQRRLAAVDFFTDAIDGVCDDSLIEAFQQCARAECFF